MAEHVESQIEALLAGRLDDEREQDVEAHLRTCEQCREHYRSEADVVSDLAAALPPVKPSLDLKARIMDKIEPVGRFRRFVDKTAQLIDVSKERALDLLEQIDESSNWEEGPTSAISLFHIEGGPATAGAIVGFIRIEPGEPFPEHEHHGTERVLVLQGAIRDSSGERFLPGDLCVMDEGTEHHLVAEEGPPLVYVVVVDEGVTIGDQFIGPDDPEL